jgi:glycosyltransferase involved in cell wall biosynthesis
MVAYHFPPLAGSSGIQRTLRFAQHLPSFGWQPLVLTAHPRAYERTSDDLNADVPPGTVVRRAFALDTARHLSIAGRYVGATARPDRWVSWRFDAVRVGLQMIREFRPTAIWSTYPIATAHLIGASLHRRSGLPWIADFRDPMAQDGYPADPLTHARYVEIERDAVLNASRSMFTTPGAAREYTRRYPGAGERIVVLENGYDEESFALAENGSVERSALNPGSFTLLHSGIVYPSERDPSQLMRALALLKAGGAVRPGELKLRFRASAHDDMLRALAAQHEVADWIELKPPLPYRDALGEMLRADALLVMQASNCNDQVPAKLYEYLRARRPIVALTDPAGDTAEVLRRSGVASSAPLDDADGIARLLLDVLRGDRGAWLGAEPAVRAASRLGRTEALARTLDALRA